MPPRIDPYANKTHQRIDVALIVITLLLMFFAFRYSAHSRIAPISHNAPVTQNSR